MANTTSNSPGSYLVSDPYVHLIQHMDVVKSPRQKVLVRRKGGGDREEGFSVHHCEGLTPH